MVRKNPLVSVVTPCYNGSPYIGISLESIQAQTFRDFEVILVDDGSTDDSLSIMQRFAAGDERFKVVHLAQNQGLTKARNVALDHARGEFVAMLDSDDLWTSDALAFRLALARRYSHADVIATDFQWFEAELPSSPQGRVSLGTRARHAFANSFATLEPTFLADPFELVATTHFAWVGATLVRRATMNAVGNFDTSFEGPEDTLLWLRLAQKGAFVFDPRITAFYRQRTGSLVTRIKGPKELPYLKVLCWIRKKPEFARFGNMIDEISANCHHVVSQYFRREGDRVSASSHAWSALNLRPQVFDHWKNLAGTSLDVIRNHRARAT